MKWPLVVASLVVLELLLSSRSVYAPSYDIDFWQSEFNRTQIVRGDKADRFYSDAEIYAIVGYKYIRGEDPTKIHPEVPPAGKALIGLSILLFRNPVLINLFLGFGCLAFLYSLGKSVTRSPLAASLLVLFVTLDSQFRYLITTSNIDIPQLFFLLLSLWAFNFGSSPRRFWLALFSLGLMMATKFYFNAGILFAVYCLYLVFLGRFSTFLAFIFCLPFVALGFVIPYWSAFAHGMTPVEFFHFQGWLTSWWAGNSRVPWGGIFPLLWSGEWHTWWGKREVISIGSQWSSLWPLSLILALPALVSVISRRLKPAALLALWSLAYLGFLSFTSPFPRYLVAETPFLYLLGLHSFSRRSGRF